jgi:hypothetical protein
MFMTKVVGVGHVKSKRFVRPQAVCDIAAEIEIFICQQKKHIEFEKGRPGEVLTKLNSQRKRGESASKEALMRHHLFDFPSKHLA